MEPLRKRKEYNMINIKDENGNTSTEAGKII